MILISSALYLLIVILLSRILINGISRVFVKNSQIGRSYLIVLLWILLLSFATWPISLGPLLFKLNCKLRTEFEITPKIDARNTEYLDELVSNWKIRKENRDGLIITKNVEDLVSGRIAFFEVEQVRRASDKERSLRYLRYRLTDIGSPNCSPKAFGFSDGQGMKVTGAPGKCIAIEPILAPSSQYIVRASGEIGDLNSTTKIVKIESQKTVAILRSFSFNYFLGFGKSDFCPNIRIAGEDLGAHLGLTKLVFIDKNGHVRAWNSD